MCPSVVRLWWERMGLAVYAPYSHPARRIVLASAEENLCLAAAAAVDAEEAAHRRQRRQSP